MNVFTSLLTNLPKDHNGNYYVFSGQEYLIYGYTNEFAKTLLIDKQLVNISPVTFYWEKKTVAPTTGAFMQIEHLVQVFGGSFDTGQISSAANIIKVFVKPSCNS